MAAPKLIVDSRLPVVQEHNARFGDFQFVYPVISRRAGGLSIGINLNPDQSCNFDCVYCQIDRSVEPVASTVDLGRVREELVALVDAARSGQLGRDLMFRDVAPLTREIKDFAFSGDGEPTLAPHFSECVQVVVEVKQRKQLPAAKIILITDAAGLDRAEVRRGLALMDMHQGEIWAKLDAGTEAYYKLINRSSVAFQRVLRNLIETARIRPIIVQSMFVRYQGEVISDTELEAYCARLTEIITGGGQVKEVHLYTLARRPAEPTVAKLIPAELDRVRDVVRRRTGLPIRAFY